MSTVTGAEFNQRPSQVKRAAEAEPVVITEHSRPSFVLMTYAEYQRLRKAPQDLSAWLQMEDDIELELEPVGLGLEAAEL